MSDTVEPKKEGFWKKLQNICKKTWNILDGNKTIIGSIAINILAFCPIPEPVKTVVIGSVSILTGAAFINHAKKGYFTTEKGH